jgi:hypothetical protein
MAQKHTADREARDTKRWEISSENDHKRLDDERPNRRRSAAQRNGGGPPQASKESLTLRGKPDRVRLRSQGRRKVKKRLDAEAGLSL